MSRKVEWYKNYLSSLYYTFGMF